MSLSEEFSKLAELRDRGVLSDEEFTRAKARLIDGAAGSGPGAAGARIGQSPVLAFFNSLRRSRGDRWLGGVCGGIAVATGVESWIWRLLFALLLFCGGTGLVAYLLLWVFVPDDGLVRTTPAGRLP